MVLYGVDFVMKSLSMVVICLVYVYFCVPNTCVFMFVDLMVCVWGGGVSVPSLVFDHYNHHILLSVLVLLP